MEKVWLKHYPAGVPAELPPLEDKSVVEVFERACAKFSNKIAYTNMGADLTYAEVEAKSRDFASFLQNVAGLKPGDRIAIQLPNLLQFPVVMFGAHRAGLVCVNTNPLYTAREMKHQFNDSGAKAIVIAANFADKLQEILPETQIKTVIVTELGDFLPTLKGAIVNFVVKYIKKMVPKYSLPQAYSIKKALSLGAARTFKSVPVSGEDLAFLQYTGGTTGVSKGAMLTHKNIVTNMEQIRAWMKPQLVEGEEVLVTPLPLYHIFSLTVNCLAFMKFGGRNILITNPRDIPGFVKELSKYKFTVLTGVNTLFNALLNNPDFSKLDFSTLKVAVQGGMALQKPVAEKWKKVTGRPLAEGYGLTETSPVASCNPIDGTEVLGTIGMPLPSTMMKILDEDGKEVPHGQPGEIAIQGPQVMKGYWERPAETQKVMTADGFFKSGDMGIVNNEGYFTIVDRKKDMILVSGFNVYPNEVEEVVASHPKVLEVGAIGVPDTHSGEVVKVYVVKRSDDVTEEEIIAWSKKNLAGYKVPRAVEFRAELPKTNVGKILRRELRNLHNASIR